MPTQSQTLLERATSLVGETEWMTHEHDIDGTRTVLAFARTRGRR